MFFLPTENFKIAQNKLKHVEDFSDMNNRKNHVILTPLGCRHFDVMKMTSFVFDLEGHINVIMTSFWKSS